MPLTAAALTTLPTPRSRYRALLWDNDGVLVDTERWYFQATREVLAAAGIPLSETDYLEYFLKQSGGLTEFVRGVTESRLDELRAARNQRYQDYLQEKSLAIEGVRETLAKLQPHFAMAIVTTSRRDHFEAMHARTGFLPYFRFALTIDECVECKPHPEPYLKAVARSGFSAADCLAIEDSPRGLAAARAAGLDCWVIPTALSRNADFSAATRVLASVTEVARILLNEAE